MELQEAIVELSLCIDDEELMKRYSLFGGSARYCLSVDTDFVAQGKVDLKQALSKIKSLADVETCFDGSADLGDTVHRLMHYVIPNPQQLFMADLVPASVEVSIMMKEKLDKDLDHERVKLMHWLDGIGKASTFSGWRFENFVHELFQKGGKFKRRRLAMNPEAAPDLTLVEQTGIYKRFKEKMAFDQIFREIYHTPEIANLQSVDSFCYFASLEGIVTLLKKLELLEDVKKCKVAVQLVFVVPLKIAAACPRQRVENKEVFDLTIEDLRAKDCGAVPGIAKKTKLQLSKINIKNVGQLL
eukprot:scaffold74622_cov64-Attheya_sp.AAC.4